jgi:hypothetical protein
MGATYRWDFLRRAGAVARDQIDTSQSATDLMGRGVKQDVIIDFNGRHIRATYSASYGIVTVNSFGDGSKSARIGAHSAKRMAEIVLREMAAEGKA